MTETEHHLPEADYGLDLTADLACAEDRSRFETEILLDAFKCAWPSRDYNKAQSMADVITELREAFFPSPAPCVPEISLATHLVPAVPVEQSVQPDFIVCLEDGAQLKTMKRYLATKFNLTPAEYRAKWHLAADYPMVAPNYAARRAEIAKSQGLGKKTTPPAPPVPPVEEHVEDGHLVISPAAAPEPVPQPLAHAIPAPEPVEADYGDAIPAPELVKA